MQLIRSALLAALVSTLAAAQATDGPTFTGVPAADANCLRGITVTAYRTVTVNPQPVPTTDAVLVAANAQLVLDGVAYAQECKASASRNGAPYSQCCEPYVRDLAPALATAC